MASSLRQARFNDDGGTTGTSLALAFSSSVLATSGLLCFWTQSDNGSTPTVSDSVNGSWTQLTGSGLPITDGGNGQKLYAFKRENSAAGTPTVTVTSSPTVDFRGMCIVEVNDPNGAVSFDKFVGQLQATPTTGTDATTSGNTAALTSQPNLVIALSDASGAAAVMAAGTGFTSGGTGWSAISQNARVESKNTSSTSAVAGTFTAAANSAHMTIAIVLLDAATSNTSPAVPTYPRRAPLRMTGPMVLRTPVQTPLPFDLAPITDTNFVFPTYPASSRLRKVGPAALRTGVQHPGLPFDLAPITDTNFVPSRYPPPTPLRMTGPMALRLPVQHPQLPLDQAPITDTNFALPQYLVRGVWRRVGPIALRRSMWLPFDLASGGDITIALTGVQATGAAGSLGVAVDTSLTGNEAAGAAGTLVATPTIGLTGNEGTGAAGNLSVSADKALTGNQATGAAGTVVATPQLALTGNQAAGAVGSLAPSAAAPLGGVAGTGQAGTLGPASGTAISGVGAAGAAGNLTATPTIGLSGNQATGAPGSLSPVAGTGLTGVEGHGQAGSGTPAVSVGLLGVEAEGQVGTMSLPGTQALSGVEAIGQAGNVGVDVVVAITGVQAFGQAGSLGVDVDKQLAGVQGAGAAGTVAVGPTGPPLIELLFDFGAPPPQLHTTLFYDQASHASMDAVPLAPARMVFDE